MEVPFEKAFIMDSSREDRAVMKLQATSLWGPVLLLFWVLFGATSSMVFASSGAGLRSIILVVLLGWAVVGPFCLSFCMVELAAFLLQRGLIDLSRKASELGISVDRSVQPLMHAIGMEDSPLAVLNLLNHANSLLASCRFDEAATTLEEALEKGHRVMGWENSLTQAVIGQLA